MARKKRRSGAAPRKRHGEPRRPTRKRRRTKSKKDNSTYWVYVIQSEQVRVGKTGNKLPGFFYVGCTTSLARRIRQHNGEIKGGAKYTQKFRPWVPRAVYGPYTGRSAAMKAEYALKKGKRGEGRLKWSKEDSHWHRGKGTGHPWVKNAKWKPAR